MKLFRVTFAMLLCVSAWRATPAEAAQFCYGLVPTITGSGTINGTSGNDVILGSSANDVINSNGGNDHICGRAGDDQIQGSFVGGEIWASGGKGNDQLTGSDSSSAHLQGDEGDDILYGGASIGVTVIQVLEGGDGNDILENGDVQDGSMSATLDGGAGNDQFPYSVATRSSDELVIVGGSGNDQIEVPVIQDGNAKIEIRGGKGDDIISLHANSESIAATIVAVIAGQPGDDQVGGINGDDASMIDNTLEGNSGSDTIIGGYGRGTTNRMDGGGDKEPDVCIAGVSSVNLFRRCV